MSEKLPGDRFPDRPFDRPGDAHSPARGVAGNLDLAGEVIAGRYRVDRLIARGGMGAVYLARHLGLQRMVALKILHPGPEVEEGGAFEERFRLEAETLASLNHPHIVTLYDYGQTDDGRYFLALEYIDGPRFTDALRSGPMEPLRASRLIIQVCRALRYAHKRGVVHRDLKPSNLLIAQDDDGQEHVKVVDFGLVKVLEDDQSLTRAGLILGSPHCMAPEQIRGLDIDHRADIYAIGILLFRSLTGRWPFHGDSSTATMISHINNLTPTFASAAPQLRFPTGLEAVTRRCLEKDPWDRFPDVNQLIAELQACFDELGAETSVSTAEPSSIGGGREASGSAVDNEPTARLPAPVISPPVGAEPPKVAPDAMGADTLPPTPANVVANTPLAARTERSDNPWRIVAILSLVVLLLFFAVMGLWVASGLLHGGGADAPEAGPTTRADPPPLTPPLPTPETAGAATADPDGSDGSDATEAAPVSAAGSGATSAPPPVDETGPKAEKKPQNKVEKKAEKKAEKPTVPAKAPEEKSEGAPAGYMGVPDYGG
jgi:serine/threonine protein kinase